MLKFVILNGFKAGERAGHHPMAFDTTKAEAVAAATVEFERLTKTEGRVALVEDAGGVVTPVTEMPEEGEVSFLLPVMGG